MVQPQADLAAAQATLGRALGRARAGEDRELSRKVREAGEALAQLLGGLLKMSRVHAPDNHAFDAPVEAFGRAVATLFGLLGPVHLVAVEDQAFVNEVRVRLEGKGGGGKDLAAELARHNAGGVTFHAPLSDAEIRGMVAVFRAPPAPEAPRHVLQAALATAGIRTVELAPRFRFRVGADARAQRGPLETVRRALALLGDAYDGLAAGRVLNPLPLRRAVLALVDGGLTAGELWEETARGGSLEAHAASVALIALRLGEAIGLGPAALQDLGVAAMVHDAGYAALSAAHAAGADGLAAHPAQGARLILRQRGFHAGKLRRLQAVLDHHRDHQEPRGEPSLVGQILRLAEDYTTLVRVYGVRISPCDALGAISRAAGRLYHPSLTQLLVNVLGRYPPGTLLELAGGVYARSISPARAPETWDRPLCRRYDPHSRALAAERIDLAEGGQVVRVLAG